MNPKIGSSLKAFFDQEALPKFNCNLKWVQPQCDCLLNWKDKAVAHNWGFRYRWKHFAFPYFKLDSEIWKEKYEVWDLLWKSTWILGYFYLFSKNEFLIIPKLIHNIGIFFEHFVFIEFIYSTTKVLVTTHRRRSYDQNHLNPDLPQVAKQRVIWQPPLAKLNCLLFLQQWEQIFLPFHRRTFW